MSYEDYDGGYSIFRIQISPGVRKGYNMNLNKSQTRLVIRFGKDLPHNVTVVTYGKHFSSFYMDHSKNVFLQEITATTNIKYITVTERTIASTSIWDMNMAGLSLNSITEIALSQYITSKYFGGCYSANTIPIFSIKNRFFYIVNSVEIENPGKHLLLIIKAEKNSIIEFFRFFMPAPIKISSGHQIIHTR